MNNKYIPLDFNSLVNLNNNILKLSNFYIDYAFEGTKPTNEIDIAFYDKYWTSNEKEIICLNGILKKNENELEPWYAEVRGNIYLSKEMPKRNSFNSFIGANTYQTSEDGKLGNISSFIFGPGSELPKFDNIVGLDTNQISNFFQFQNLSIIPPMTNPDGSLDDNTLVVRGGGNTIE